MGLISEPVKLDTVSPTARHAATFLRSCVAQALSRGDKSHHSLRDLVQYREYNEDFLMGGYRVQTVLPLYYSMVDFQSDDAGTVFVQTCDENNLESNEVWRFTDSSTLLMHHPTRRCLSVPSGMVQVCVVDCRLELCT